MIFKAMGRETNGYTARYANAKGWSQPSVICERCGGQVFQGDWPFCREGNPEDHKRD